MDRQRARAGVAQEEPKRHPGASPAGGRLQEAARRQPFTMLGLGVLLYATGPVLIQASAVPGAVFSFWRLLIGVPVLMLALPLHLRLGGRWPARRAWRWAALGGLAFGITSCCS